MVFHRGTVDVPPGREEFQQLREELICGLGPVAHISDKVPRLSRETP